MEGKNTKSIDRCCCYKGRNKVLKTKLAFCSKIPFKSDHWFQNLTVLNCVLLHICQRYISFLNDIKVYTNLEFYFVTSVKKYPVCNIIYYFVVPISWHLTYTTLKRALYSRLLCTFFLAKFPPQR